MSSASAAIAIESANPSTGPRTPEGKARSSRNALQHGLASETMVIVPESAAEWEEFRDGMFAEWLPATPTEQALVGDMAKHQWLKERAIRLQNQLLQYDIDLKEAKTNRFSVLMRYQITNERAFARAMKQLEALRKNRQPEFVSQNAETVAKPSIPLPPKKRKIHLISSLNTDPLQEVGHQVKERNVALGSEPLPFGIVG